MNVPDKDNIQKKFTLTKQKQQWINKSLKNNKEIYMKRYSKSLLGRTYDYNYVNSNNSKPSLSRKWDDWDIKKQKKASMKLSVALHFTKWIYLTKNSTSKVLSPGMIKLVKVHNISMIPKS